MLLPHVLYLSLLEDLLSFDLSFAFLLPGSLLQELLVKSPETKVPQPPVEKVQEKAGAHKTSATVCNLPIEPICMMNIRLMKSMQYIYIHTSHFQVAISYPILSYQLTSYYTMSYHITSYHITSHHITSHHITSHHITSHHIISYHLISHHIISYYIISYHHIKS